MNEHVAQARPPRLGAHTAPRSGASSSSPARLGYHPALDGIRSVAVALVLAFHAHVLPGGYLGVDVFFVLSGFLITALALEEWTRTQRLHIRYFYFRRAARLLPALLVLLLTYVLGIVPLIQRSFAHPTGAAVREALGAVGYVMNWELIFHQVQAPFLSHTWSLAVEEQFYLVWPVLLVLLLRRVPQRSLGRTIFMLALLAWVYRWLLLVNGAPLDRIYLGTDTRADLLLIGAAAAAWRWNGGQLRHIACWLPWVVLGSIGTIIWKTNTYGLLVNLLLSPSIALCTASLLLLLVAPIPSRMRTWFEWRPLVWLGQRSYGIYLWHHPLMFTLQVFAFPPVSVLLVAGGISIIAAALSYTYVEQPVMRWARARFSVR